MRPPTETELKEFCRLAGVPWHEWDGINYGGCSCGANCANLSEHIKASNSTFSHPRAVLKIIDSHPNAKLFYGKLIGYIDNNLIVEDYALFWAAFEWLKKGE